VHGLTRIASQGRRPAPRGERRSAERPQAPRAPGRLRPRLPIAPRHAGTWTPRTGRLRDTKTLQLSMTHQLLPKEEWTKPDEVSTTMSVEGGMPLI
jgi:hypothetical protein